MPEYDVEVLRFEVAKLELKCGDVLVFRPPAAWPNALTKDDIARLGAMVPDGVQIWCIPQDVEMVVMSTPREEIR